MKDFKLRNSTLFLEDIFFLLFSSKGELVFWFWELKVKGWEVFAMDCLNMSNIFISHDNDIIAIANS